MRVLRDTIGIKGMGYIGLPLSMECVKKYRTVAFAFNAAWIDELRLGRDSTLEATTEELNSSKKLTFIKTINAFEKCNIFFVMVPTPIAKREFC